ncbi:MAG TPA: DinB family protein [Gemmatimonadales bacterium]|nr:DinB family protein [Gemmatimonadales bacterium]
MSTTTTGKTATPSGLDPSVSARILEEGYGPGAWHGPDLKAALAGISPQAAFWRPARGRHNVAEIALHHAWCVRSVVGQLTGSTPESFVLEGADWFEVSDGKRLGWPEIAAVVEEEQRRLAAVIADIGAGRIPSPLAERERFDLVLGITCHAVYHAGQVQLLKVLGAA